MDVDTFIFNGDTWTNALSKDMAENVTFRYDMIGLIQNEHENDSGSINV